MKTATVQKTRVLSVGAATILAVIIGVNVGSQTPPAARAYTAQETQESKAAFLKAYTVFMSPRCMNCHPNGDVPLQGEDSHLHTQNVKRGLDGKGLFAMQCKSCHQDENTPGLNMPPGHPEWHLPPADMPMVFQGRTPAQLAAQFKDIQQTGKTLEEMIKHNAEDSLVGAGWKPAEGLKPPPMSREEFAAAFKEWVDKGAAVPE